MLFPLEPNTPQCEVFQVLNSELLYFLEKSINRVHFTETLFSQYLDQNVQQKRSVCWSNAETKNKFKAVFQSLPDTQDERQELYDSILDAQTIEDHFENDATKLPPLNDDLFDKFKSLTSHLFNRTKDLAGAKEQAQTSIGEHFQSFKRANHNTQLCYLCGTAELSQDREGIHEKDQWRADYDHMLCKDKYPVFTVHPGNFIPICHICNSKAKGADDLLRDSQGNRRKAFYCLPPLQESCYQFAKVEPRFLSQHDIAQGKWESPISSVEVMFEGMPVDIDKKIDVWTEVYEVPNRVKSKVSDSFVESLSSDFFAENFEQFRERLDQRAGVMPVDYKKAAWRFWWQKVYEYLNAQDEAYLRSVWDMIQWKLDHSRDQNMQEVFDF